MKDRIKQLIEVDWRELKPIQPEDVKIQNNLEALKSSLKKHGFSLPFAVWIDGTLWLLLILILRLKMAL